MKIIITLLALLNGGFMLLDGIFVMVKGKYIGPEKPGPWANLFYKLNVDVFKLGPMFVFFGMLWLIWLYNFWVHPGRSYIPGILISILTLWYIPVGTAVSVIVLFSLLLARKKLGM